LSKEARFEKDGQNMFRNFGSTWLPNLVQHGCQIWFKHGCQILGKVGARLRCDEAKILVILLSTILGWSNVGFFFKVFSKLSFCNFDVF